MWLKKMKKKKIQFLIITLILLMATAILQACIALAWETQNFVNEYYNVKNCPMYFTIRSDDQGKELLEAEAEAMKLIDKIETGEAKYVESNFYHGNIKLHNESTIIYELNDKASLGYPIEVLEGEDKKSPGNNEIWITHIYANAFHVAVGDQILIGQKDNVSYTVSAIVSTPESSSGFIDVYPFYVNKATLQGITGKQVYTVRIYAKNENTSIKQMDDSLPKEFTEKILVSFDRDVFKMCLSILSGIFGGVGIAASLVIFIVSIVIIRYMIRATIANEYKLIGIYKAQGKTDTEIKKIYYNCYLIAGVIGILGGLFVGRPLAKYLSNIVLGGIKGFHLTGISYLISLLVVISMTTVLALNIWRELKKITKITPVQAMAVGSASSNKKMCKSLIPNAHSSFAMAVNEIFKKRSMSVLVILILTVSFFLCLLACSVSLTLGHYAEDKEIWENLPNYSGYVNIVDDEKVLEYMKRSSYVKDFVAMSLEEEYTKLKFEDSDLTSSRANPMIYSDFIEKRYEDVPFTKGRICVNPHEITCSEKFLKEVNKSVGEYLEIKFGDKKIDFLISGSYSAMTRGGTSFYIKEKDIRELGLACDLSTVLFFLKDDVSYEQFEKEFEKQFPKSKIFKEFDFITQEGDTVSSIANPICIVIFAAFAAFSILNIINLIYTQIRENRKKYGILKAYGFTTGYLYRQNIIQMTMLSIVAIGLTIILQEFASPKIFSLACGLNYIYKPAWLTALVCCGMYGAIMVLTIIMLLPIRKITPVELMEE